MSIKKKKVEYVEGDFIDLVDSEEGILNDLSPSKADSNSDDSDCIIISSSDDEYDPSLITSVREKIIKFPLANPQPASRSMNSETLSVDEPIKIDKNRDSPSSTKTALKGSRSATVKKFQLGSEDMLEEISWDSDFFKPTIVNDICFSSQKIDSLRRLISSVVSEKQSELPTKGSLRIVENHQNCEHISMRSTTQLNFSNISPANTFHSDRSVTKSSTSPLVSSSSNSKSNMDLMGPPLKRVAPKLIIVFGPPGVGKSTAVKTVLDELGCAYTSWIDPESRGVGRMMKGNGTAEYFKALRGDSNSIDLHVLRHQESFALDSTEANIPYRKHDLPPILRSLKYASEFRAASASALIDFANFLQTRQSFGRLLTSSAGIGGVGLKKTCSDVDFTLVEDLPRPSTGILTPAWAHAIDVLLVSYIGSSFSRHPMVLVLSEGCNPSDVLTLPTLKRLLPLTFGASSSSDVVATFEAGPVSDAQLRGALQGLVARVRATLKCIPLSERSGFVLRLLKSSPTHDNAAIQSAVDAANGDLRHAVKSLEFYYRSGGSDSSRKSKSQRLSRPVHGLGAFMGNASLARPPVFAAPSSKMPERRGENAEDVKNQVEENRRRQKGSCDLNMIKTKKKRLRKAVSSDDSQESSEEISEDSYEVSSDEFSSQSKSEFGPSRTEEHLKKTASLGGSTKGKNSQSSFNSNNFEDLFSPNPSSLVDMKVSRELGRKYLEAEFVYGPLRKLTKANAPRSRDNFFQPLHMLGKLLYSKRDAQGHLENDPEGVMTESALPESVSALFLLQNAPSFFSATESGLEGLCAALDDFSLSEIVRSRYWSNSYQSQGGNELSAEAEEATDIQKLCGSMAVSLASRAVGARKIQFPGAEASKKFQALKKSMYPTVSQLRYENLSVLSHWPAGIGILKYTVPDVDGTVSILANRYTKRHSVVEFFPVLALMAASRSGQSLIFPVDNSVRTLLKTLAHYKLPQNSIPKEINDEKFSKWSSALEVKTTSTPRFGVSQLSSKPVNKAHSHAPDNGFTNQMENEIYFSIEEFSSD